MRVLCDTSVLVPGLWKWHDDHEVCAPWLSAAVASQIELVIAVHSLAETYSVLTRLPTKPRIAPEDAWRVMETGLLSNAKLIDVPSAVYQTVLADLASRKIGGGIIYDALIAAAAELAQVDLLLTFNVPHFEIAWPQGCGRIASPKTVTAP